MRETILEKLLRDLERKYFNSKGFDRAKYKEEIRKVLNAKILIRRKK